MKIKYDYQYKDICGLLKGYIFKQLELIPGEEEEGSENEALVNFIKKENNFVHLFEIAFLGDDENWVTENNSQSSTDTPSTDGPILPSDPTDISETT